MENSQTCSQDSVNKMLRDAALVHKLFTRSLPGTNLTIQGK